MNQAIDIYWHQLWKMSGKSYAHKLGSKANESNDEQVNLPGSAE